MSERPTDVRGDPPGADKEEPTLTDDDAGPGTDESVPADDSDERAESERPDDRPRRRFDWRRWLVFVVLPGLAFVLAIAAGLFKWHDGKLRGSEIAGDQALQAARQGTVAMLSYKPDTVDKDLTAASNHLTGSFRDSYTSLTQTVVIPGAKQQRISAVAQVPAAATVSASSNRAVVLVFVDQTTVIGNGAPTDTASVVRVKLDKVGDQWLISDFQPI